MPDPTPQPDASPPPPDFARVYAVFTTFVALVSVIVVLDNATYKLTSGSSVRGFDYLVLGLGIAFLVMLVVARPLAKRLAVAATAVILTIFVVELGLTAWSAMSDRAFAWYIWPPNYRAILEPQGLPGVSESGTFTVNSRGLRGPEFGDDDALRILCIGGSTTECLYLDDAKTWPRLLEDYLNGPYGDRPAGWATDGKGRVWVGNGGRSGLLTFDHTTALANLPEARMSHTWIVLCGINDMGNQMRGSYDQAAQRTWSRTFVYRRPGLLGWPRRPLHRNLYLFNLLENLRARAKLAMRGQDFTAFQDRKAVWVEELRQRRAQGKLIDELPDMKPLLDEYERQLMRLIELARREGKSLILITQPTIWSADMTNQQERLTLAGELREGEFLSNVKRAEGMDAYNQRMIDVARREGVTCIDIASMLPKSTETFYDDCHFNETGAEAFARAIADTFAGVTEMVPPSD